jgi:hypothetical protein
VVDRDEKAPTLSAASETSGKLADGPLPTLLHSLFVAKATGVVKLDTRTGQHSLYLREGYPVSVTLPGSAELLGKVLVEMGILDEAVHRQTMAQPPPKGKRYGEMLLEKGLVTADQMRLGLKAQVRRKLHRLFFLNDGTWVFQTGKHDRGLQGPESLRVHPYRAIYHGVRSAWPADQLQGALFLLEGKAIKAKISADEAARYGLGQDDGRVAELLRKGYWTLLDLVDGSGLPAQPVHALVYSFYITDALDIQLADAVPRLKRKADAGEITTRTQGSFLGPQATTAKSIPRPGAPPPPVAPPAGTPPPAQSNSRSPSGSQPAQPGVRPASRTPTGNPTTPPEPQPSVVQPPPSSVPRPTGRTPTGTHTTVPRPTSTTPTGTHTTVPRPTSTTPTGTRTTPERQPSGVYPTAGRATSGNYPTQGGREPSGVHPTQGGTSGTAYPKLPGGGIDVPAVRRQFELKAKVVEAETLFEVLELEPSADRDTIKSAYFEAARRYHPDRLTSLGLESMQSDVEKIFRRVSEAYATLYDDTKREAYREQLAKPRTGQDADAHAKAMKMLEAEMAFRRGEILLRKNDYAGALVEMEGAVAANPAEGEHLAYLTWCKLCLGQITHTAARPLFQEAVKLTPMCARAFYFLGLCYKEEEAMDKALNAFKKAADLDPRLLDAEREMRLINMRREKTKSGFLNKLLSKK